MDQKNFLTQMSGFLKAKQRRRWWLRTVTGMAAVVVFMTIYLLILPAITMENSIFEVTVTSPEADLAETIPSEIYATADSGQESTCFVLNVDGDNAGLDESHLDFDTDSMAVLEDENGNSIELHREYTEDGKARYWFVLEEGQSARFSLTWVNGVDCSSEVIEEKTSGESEQAGSLTITFGCGSSKEIAQEQTEKKLELSWTASEPPLSMPEDDDSVDTVEKQPSSDEVVQPVRSRAAVLSDSGAAEANSSGYDFENDITQVTVSHMVNGQWEPAQTFTDGENVQVTIGYSIGADTIGADGNKMIYYQMPEGIHLAKQEGGTVYDGKEAVGTYTVSPEGLITITFNSNYADNKAFTGQIQFQGTVSVDGSGENHEISFGSGGTITVIPGAEDHDVRVTKQGNYSTGDQKLHYTLEVNTTKGTGGAVTVTDSFNSGNTAATYDTGSFQIIKVANGKEIPMAGYTPVIGTAWPGGPQKFTLSDLPALEAGESYRITYTATPGKTTSLDGYSSVNNSVSVSTEGGDNAWGSSQVVIHRNMLTKSGNYDSSSQTINWTITINPDKQDIGGYVLQDKLTVPTGNATVGLPEQVTLVGSDGVPTSITLPYTFPDGSSDSYTITYQTKVEDLGDGEQARVDNEVSLEGDNRYQTGTVVYPQGATLDSGKRFTSHNADQDETGKTGIYHWQGWISVPPNADDLNSLTYTDTIYDLTATGEDGSNTRVPGSHYITGPQLRDMVVRTNVGTSGILVYGQDYLIYTVDSNGTERQLLRTNGDYDGTKTYSNFKVKFTQNSLSRIQNTTVWLEYLTTVDYSKLTANTTYTITNRGGVPGHEKDVSTTYKPEGKLEKQSSITGVTNNNSTSYTGGGIDIDYSASEGIIHYRLLIRTDENTKGDIKITDLLPAGATLQEDTVTMQFYGNDYYEYSEISANGQTYKATDHIHSNISNKNADGTTTVTFTIDNGYNLNGNTNTLVIYYEVNIAEDPLWENNPALEEHLYTNKATWGETTVENNVTVNREVPDLDKTGERVPQYDADGNLMKDNDGNILYSNTIRYHVLVNAGGKDLVPELDFITLSDKLSIGNAAGAAFQPGSVHLYSYDHNKSDNCGEEIDQSLYSFTYDEENYALSFDLPDETPCVLVYDYAIDRGNAAGDLTISNQIHLTGGESTGSKNDIVLSDTSSSASVSKREITLYKVDATDYGTLLPAAVFKLEEYANGRWTELVDKLTTDANGQFTLARTDDEQFESFNFKDNTLYRLTEVVAPDGYSKSNSEIYFVWVKNGQTAEGVKNEMVSGGQLGEVAPDSVRFVTTSASLYVPNEPTTLTVKKVWQDGNGVTTTPGAEEVGITLYQQAVVSNARKVTVISQGNLVNGWRQDPVTRYVDVAEGSSLTIQVGNSWGNAQDFQVGNTTPETVQPDTNDVCTFTVQAITEDTTIMIHPSNQNVGNTFGQISFSGYTTPYFVPNGEAVKYQTIELTETNNWSHTWDNLPKKNDKGQTVYYHVAETNPVSGFEVIYSSNNNNGVQAGELVVINRKQFTMPETGGVGTKVFTTGGLALLALAGLIYIRLRQRGGGSP